MTILIRAGETETVSAYFVARTDIHAASSVKVGVGSYSSPPASWSDPDVPATFSTDGLTVTVSVTLGNGHLNSSGRVWLWVKVADAPQTLIERLQPSSYTFVDTGGVVPMTLPPYVVALTSTDASVAIDATDPTHPDLSVAGGAGTVQSVTAADSTVTVDNIDPANPTIAVTAGTFDASGAAAAAQAAAIAASQPVDSDLTAIAALSTTTYGRALLTQADAAALRTTAGLGTAATSNTTAFDAAGAAAAAQAASQPLDSDLTAIAALTTTSFGRSFLALADAAAGRTLLGLGTLATQSGTFSGTSSGTNTGDQSIPTALPPNGAASGDLSGTYPSPNVAKVNGTALSGLATGLLKNTTGTGVPSIATGADVPNIAESQVTNLTADLAAKAPLASPALTGTPTAPTASASTNNTQLATTAYADAKVENAVTAGHTTVAPSGDSVSTALALKAPLASPALTGSPTAPTQTAADNSTKLATTAYADAAVTAAKAPGRGRLVSSSGGVEPYWIPGVEFTGREDFAPTINTTYYCPFYVTNTTTVTKAAVNISVAVAASTCRVGVYKAGLDLQPTGTLVGDVGLSTAATGTVVGTVSWTLQPGRYLVAVNFTGAVSARILRGAIKYLDNSGTFPQTFIMSTSVAETIASFASTGTLWTTITTGSTGTGASLGIRYPVMLNCSEAS